MQNIILYSITALIVVYTFIKDRKRTIKALLKAWKAVEGILPQLLAIITLVGIMLALIDADTISRLLGSRSGLTGIIIASVIGAITLIPGFIAFPTAAMLLNTGAGYMQIGAFISSLMMVGVITLPLEVKYFGRRSALLRNILAFMFSFIAAFIIGFVMGEI